MCLLSRPWLPAASACAILAPHAAPATPNGSWVVTLGLCVASSVRPPLADAQSGRVAIALWTPEQSNPLAIALDDGAMSVTSEGSHGIWLANEYGVTRFADGLWESIQQPPGNGGLFALAPSGEDSWAFGFEGAIWRRMAGQWSQRASPTQADLYAAAVGGAGEAWAAGFDYVTEQGTLVRATDNGSEAFTWPELYRQQLYSLAVAPDGTLWAGGCSYEDRPLLLRGYGYGWWQEVPVPLTGGCVFHLSFAPGGSGLAAAGSDLLAWDGAAWHAMGQPPPAGLQWLRVAALDDPPGTPDATGEGAGWAIPATPSWRGYVAGATPWYFDGQAWDEGAVDYGPYGSEFEAGNEPGPRPFVGLAADDQGMAWTVSIGSSGLVGLVRLDAGIGQLWHPGIEVAHDVAALPDGTVWVAGSGATPLLGRVNGQWTAGVRATDNDRPEFRLVDLASSGSGWALANDATGDSGTVAPWRWDGQQWSAVPPPPGRQIRRIRALPDGGAWAADQRGQLIAWQAGSWADVPGAPIVELATASDEAPNVRLPTPFDAAGEPDAWVACVAAGDAVYRYEAGAFSRLPAPRGARFVDVQLVDAGHGWALPAELVAQQLSAQVAQLTDCRPELLRVADLPVGSLAPSRPWRRPGWTPCGSIGARAVPALRRSWWASARGPRCPTCRRWSAAAYEVWPRFPSLPAVAQTCGWRADRGLERRSTPAVPWHPCPWRPTSALSAA